MVLQPTVEEYFKRSNGTIKYQTKLIREILKNLYFKPYKKNYRHEKSK